MLICAGVIAVLLGLFGRNMDLPVALMGGLLFCPLLWLMYRLARFITGY
jgi:hypothetical protein